MGDVNVLLAAMTERASLLGLPVMEDPRELLERRLMAEAIRESMGAGAAPAVDSDAEHLPVGVRALAVGYHSILVGDLGDDPDRAAVHDHLRRWHNQAVIARSWLGARGDDLVLVLVAPPAAVADARWINAARQIERNERVCRKLVWLPPADDATMAESLEDFFARSCLARPWTEGPRQDQAALDAMATLATDIADDTLTAAAAHRWLNLLSHDDLDREDMMEALVAALEDET